MLIRVILLIASNLVRLSSFQLFARRQLRHPDAAKRKLANNFNNQHPQWRGCCSPPPSLPINSYSSLRASLNRREPYCIENIEEEACYIPDTDEVSSAGYYTEAKTSTEPSKLDFVNPNGAPFTALSTSSSVASRSSSAKGVITTTDWFLLIFPVLAPCAAFFSYTNVQTLFTQFLELLSDAKWVAVDGGLYQTQTITPAINGIVMPAVAVLFATLISNTVTTLRQRQLTIRTSLNMEASEIRILQSMIDSFPVGEDANNFSDGSDADDGGLTLSDYQDRCRRYLMQYVIRILAESQDTVNYSSLEYTGSIDSEMNALLAYLNTLSCKEHQARLVTTNPNLLSESYAAITRLNSERATRISALQSTFPALHYVILCLLAVSILVTFLIETGQKANLFLNQVQLQLLWTILIGTFAALGTVLYDLTDPFKGSYQVSGSRRQLFTIRDALRASAQMKAGASNGKASIQ